MFIWLEKPPLLAGLKQFFRLLKRHSNKNFALLFAIGISLSLAISACTPSNSANPTSPSANNQGQGTENVVRVGHQKYGTLSIVKAQGGLEKRLASLGASVQWIEFPAGPQLLEALNAGSIDFGHTGETPPIFAQAAGAPLVYVASEPPAPKAEAILVPKDSAIRSIGDLKGKKIVLNKGSNVHYLLVQALASAGLELSDIKPVYLAPAEARAAFDRGSVDAWVIWDPFFAVAQQATGARVLKDGEGLVANREFYLASQTYANQHSDYIKATLEEIQKVDEWAATRPKEVATLLSPKLGIDPAIVETVARRRPYGVQPIQDEVITYQQQVADTFFRLKLIPKQLNVKDVAGYQNNKA